MRPALLLLHGWTLDSRMWAPQMEAFAPARQVIAPDRRGFGQSSAPPAPSKEGDDLVAVLDAFAVERAVVVGMSQGGRIALEFARLHPNRIAALVLQGARFDHGAGRTEIPIAHYTALIRTGRIDEMRRLWAAHAMMQTKTPVAQQAADLMLASYDGRDLSANTGALPELKAAEISSITAPALVVTGALDTEHRHTSAAALARALPQAASITNGDAGHLCNLCRAEA
ncbi:MAG TPA: alpha/beta hydrolase, partial [Verrucomicrobiae bacterium]|nr:alpha/beta hydrolase [Verrucomicrobiae bacterium]